MVIASFIVSLIALFFTGLKFINDSYKDWSTITAEFDLRYDENVVLFGENDNIIPLNEFKNGGFFINVKVLNTGTRDIGYTDFKLFHVNENGKETKIDTLEPKFSPYKEIYFNYPHSSKFNKFVKPLVLHPSELSDGSGVLKAQNWTNIGMIAYGYKEYSQVPTPHITYFDEGKNTFRLKIRVVKPKNIIFNIFQKDTFEQDFEKVIHNSK